MPSLQNLLKRRPEIPEDPEVRARVEARLATLRNSYPVSTLAPEPEPEPEPDEAAPDDVASDERTDEPVGYVAIEVLGWPAAGPDRVVEDEPVAQPAIDAAPELAALGEAEALADDVPPADVPPAGVRTSTGRALDLEDWDPEPVASGIELDSPMDAAPEDERLETEAPIPAQAADPIAVPVAFVESSEATALSEAAAPPEATASPEPAALPEPARADEADVPGSGAPPTVAKRSFAERIFGKRPLAKPESVTAGAVETTAATAAAITKVPAGRARAVKAGGAKPKVSKARVSKAGVSKAGVSKAKASKPGSLPRVAKLKAPKAGAGARPSARPEAASPRATRLDVPRPELPTPMAALATPVPSTAFAGSEPEPEAALPAVARHGLTIVPPRPARDVYIRPRPVSTPGIATCPYCAVVLEPAPVASGRCSRCRQRIVVRRLAGRAIYLTEAALPVFEAERRRAVHAPRWTRDRDRWLALASASGATPDRLARITRLPLSEEVVAASRTMYLGLVDRSVRDARLDRRWDEAARLRFDQAMAVYRLAGSPKVLPADVVAFHREGLAALLRSIGEVARSAELRAATCCDICRADDGRTVRVAAELREPTLPHAGCSKGVCRCRWLLADRDRTIVSDLLRRHSRPVRRRA